MLTITPKIEEYLKQNTDIVLVLPEVIEKIKKYFPENIDLELELFHDPEDDSESLILEIVTNENWETIDEIYDKFFDEYWIYKVPLYGSKFSIMTYFV